MRSWIGYSGLGLFVLAACAPSSSTSRTASPKAVEPMSVAGHERTADDLEAAAGGEEKRYAPNARPSGGMCRGRPEPTEDVCWTSLVNPTDKYLKHAEEHRKLAAQHRAAAKTLRDAEARACADVSPIDRDESPFEHPEDIVKVEPLHGSVSKFLNEPWTEGVVVTFRALPGMTVAWLQQVVDCQLARNAAMGHEVPELEACLLVPRNVRAAVGTTPEGLTITVRAGDRAAADELFRRAELLNNAVRTSRSGEAASAPGSRPPAAAP